MVPLISGGCDHPARTGDDLLLAGDAVRRFWSVTVGKRTVLDLCQGVGRVHQRDRPSPGEGEPHLA